MSVIASLVEKGLVTEPDSAKGRLIQAAAQLFKEKGYGRTTVRDLAAQVGILSGSLFHHFPNKEAILRTVAQEGIYRVIADIERSLQNVEEPCEQLKVLIRCEGRAIHSQDNPGFQLLVPEWRSLSVESQGHVLTLRDQYENIWRDVLDRLFEQGLVKVEGHFLRHFLRGALMESSNWFDAKGKLSLAELEEKLFQVVVH